MGSYAFAYCDSLKHIGLPNSLTNIGSFAFTECLQLNSVTPSNSLKTINSYAFYGCTLLPEITIPQSVTTIWKGAFQGCTSLSTLNWNSQNLNSYQGGQYDNDIINSTARADNYHPFKGCTALQNINIGTTAQSLPQFAFYNLPIKHVTFGEQLVSLPNYCFYNCDRLDSITVTAPITQLNTYCFAECDSLKRAHFPNTLTTVGSYAFNNCTQLSAIWLPTSVTTINNYAFNGCTGMQVLWVDAVTPPSTSSNTFSSVPTDIMVYVRCVSKAQYQAAANWSNFTNYIGYGIIPDTVTVTSCDSYTWRGNTYTTSGDYNSTTTFNDCDSVITLRLTINPSKHTNLFEEACESYTWNGNTYTESGNYPITFTSAKGCDSIVTLHLTILPLPTPGIFGSTVICQGEATTLTASGGTSYVWSDASTDNSITVSQSGIYTVTATNAQGCSAPASVTVTVNPLPNVAISGGSSFCQGDSLTLTASGASTYTWSNVSSIATTTVSSAGTYTVTGTDANGCSNTASKTVTVNPTYNTPLTHSMCEGESYNFFGQNITAAGTYTHTLQTVDGCDSVLTLVVTLEALPPTAITGNTTICEGETTTLTANGGVSYLWSDASTSNSTTVSQSGIYTVTATNAQGCSAPASVTVTVNPLPNVNISGNTNICAGSSTTLTASGANSYIWSTGDSTATTTVSAFGVYTVTGTSSDGCSNTANATVLVSQLPVITISGETNLCAGENTTLTANGGDTYLWNDGTTSNSLTVGAAGTYQVIGYNEAGCSSMADATVSVWQPASSEFSITTPDSCYEWNSVPYCASGDYTQTLETVHGCDSIVTLHLTVSVGIDNYDGFDLKVYPNPTTGMVNVQWTMNNGHEEPMDILVYDAFGRLLRSTDGVGANNHSSLRTAQFDMSGYAAGVYFVKAVADGNVVAVRKVIRN